MTAPPNHTNGFRQMLRRRSGATGYGIDGIGLGIGWFTGPTYESAGRAGMGAPGFGCRGLSPPPRVRQHRGVPSRSVHRGSPIRCLAVVAAATALAGAGACRSEPEAGPAPGTEPPAIAGTCRTLAPVLGPAPGSVSADEGVRRTAVAYRAALADAPAEIVPSLTELVRLADALVAEQDRAAGPDPQAAPGVDPGTTVGTMPSGPELDRGLDQQQALEAWYGAFCE